MDSPADAIYRRARHAFRCVACEAPVAAGVIYVSLPLISGPDTERRIKVCEDCGGPYPIGLPLWTAKVEMACAACSCRLHEGDDVYGDSCSIKCALAREEA